MRGLRVIAPYSGQIIRSLDCCNMWFPCEETGLAATGEFTDISGGVVLQPSLGGGDWGVTNGSTGYNSVYPNASSSASSIWPVKSGAWPNYGTDSIVMLAVGKIIDHTKCRLPIGNGTNDNSVYPFDDLSVSMYTNFHTLIRDNASVSHWTAAYTTDSNLQGGGDTYKVANDQTVAIILVYRANAGINECRVLKINGNQSTEGTVEPSSVSPFPDLSYTGSATQTAVGALGEIWPGRNGGGCTRVNGIALYGWATFVFSAIPSDWSTACIWMANNWATRSSNRSLYPGWVGR